jgi:phytoene synthase
MDFAADVRARDRTAFLATLFAPEATRPALLALNAYRLELERVVDSIREPLAAEIRLQWWRDAIRGEGYGEGGAAVPLVEALRAAMTRYAWPADALCAMSEARIHDLYADPFADWDAFDGYAGEAYGTPIQLAAMALCVDALGAEDGHAAARSAATPAGWAGVAEAAADAATAFVPRFRRARAQVPAPAWRQATGTDLKTALESGQLPGGAAEAVRALVTHGERADEEMRRLAGSVAPQARAAFLTAFTARRRLAAVRRSPLSPRQPGALAMQWALWRAARTLSRA